MAWSATEKGSIREEGTEVFSVEASAEVWSERAEVRRGRRGEGRGRARRSDILEWWRRGWLVVVWEGGWKERRRLGDCSFWGRMLSSEDFYSRQDRFGFVELGSASPAAAGCSFYQEEERIKFTISEQVGNA